MLNDEVLYASLIMKHILVQHSLFQQDFLLLEQHQCMKAAIT